MTQTAIIHYGLGNLSSVHNAIAFNNGDSYIAEKPEDIKDAGHVILPGVGAFGDGMENLRKNGWVDAIRNHALEKQRPFLGVCLGMQLLASSGTENGSIEGLNLIAGTVTRLSAPDRSVRIPHIGWNSVTLQNNPLSYKDIPEPLDYYFVHSYAMQPEDTAVISATCYHGQEFVASVEKDNIWGAQYHPEKSQQAGLLYLANFLNM